MKRLRIIPKICEWFVYMAILFIVIAAISSIVGILPFFGKGYRPESTEGMLHWSTSTSVHMGRYVLSKEAEYFADSLDGEFIDYFSLKVPFPRAGEVSWADKSSFSILNKGKYEIQAERDTQIISPVIYNFYGKSEMFWIRTIFILGILSVLALTIYWLWVLRGLIRGMAKGHFFERRNHTRLIILSIPAFLLPLGEYLLGFISLRFFTNNFRVLNGGFNATINPDLTPVAFGIIFLLMAAMVYEGSKLKEEQDLTI